MVGKVYNIRDLVATDYLGCEIARKWMEWNSFRQPKMDDWKEVRKYVYATDTTKTTNAKLPWKNKTTVPKLCQIRDNLHANYMASMFPKRNWLIWEAGSRDANSLAKRTAITQYMSWVSNQQNFKREMSKLVLDYIDYGNAFATVEWVDQRNQVEEEEREQTGYVGPGILRISPQDIVFNPTAPSFEESPKIIRSLVSLGEIKGILESMSTSEDEEMYNDLFKYIMELRNTVSNIGSELQEKDEMFGVDGFTSFRSYLESDYVELLTFYGDMYDREKNSFYKNVKIVVVDRHKVIYNKPNPSYFGYPPIFHVGWRKRQDNLWAMGPLDNLVGLQYRIDHIENLKADVFDLITFPPLKIKGAVDDFEWGPFSRIHIGDDGDVEMMIPPFQVLQANQEIAILLQLMEEMAGAPKEAMGFRTPGEKTAYEVQRLENAASRIFQNKIKQFEEEFVERLLNAELELARRNVASAMAIPVFNDEFKMQTFVTLTPNDIVGAGRIKPVAARHFAERAEIIQNITAFMGSAVGMDEAIKEHFSSIQLSKLFEELLELQDYEIVRPYVRLTEKADAQRLFNAHAEAVQMEAGMPTGMEPEGQAPAPEQAQGAPF